MKKNLKKIVVILILMILTLTISGVALHNYAATTTATIGTNVSATFNSSTGALTITSTSGKGTIVWSDWYNFIYSVGKTNVKTITFSNAVYAFANSSSGSAYDFFKEMDNLTTINNIGNFDTSNITNMVDMFYKCSSLTSLDLRSWNTSKVDCTTCMFEYCTSLKSVNMSGLNLTSVRYMVDMFRYCSVLETVNLTNVKTSTTLTTMAFMFSGCNSLKSADISSFDTSNVYDFSKVFNGCRSLTSVNVSGLTTTKISDIDSMFYGCSSLTTLNLSSFDLSKVTDTNNIDCMLLGCSNLKEIYTPKRYPTVSIELPGLFYNASNTSSTTGYYSIPSSGFSGSVRLSKGYVITYRPNGATGDNVTQIKYYGTNATLKTNSFTAPTGKKFTGWNTSSSGSGTAYSAGATYSTDATLNLYAQWEGNVYTITLNNQSATSAGTTTIYEKYGTGYYTNSSATTQMTTSSNGITIPTRTGYIFGGYYTATNGGGTQYISANGRLTSSASNTNFTAAGTLYAKWTIQTNTVTLNNQSATTTGTTSVTATYGSNMPSITAPTKTGYTFGGYYTSTNGGGTQYYTATGMSARTWDKTTNTTLYANWIINKYTVTFKNEGTTVSTQTIEYGKAAVAPTNLSKTGYKLSWDKEFNNITSDLIVNAVWTKSTDIQYKIEYYKQKVTKDGYEALEEDTVSKTGTTGETVSVSIIDLKTFEGFEYDTENSNNVLSGILAADGSTALKLYYNRNSFSKEIRDIEGNLITTIEGVYGEEITLPTDLIKKGYTFGGWYTDENFENAITTIRAEDLDSTTLYIKWIPNVYEITLNLNDDIPEKYEEFDVDGKIYIPKTNLSLPILSSASVNSMQKSVAVLFGPGLNEEGNTGIVGQNYRDGRFFANNKNIEVGDIVYVTDKTGKIIGYEVYDIQTVEPENADHMSKDTEGRREITLESITDDTLNRLIISAKEKTSKHVYDTETVLPTDIIRDGYTFLGWYDNEELSGETITKISSSEIGDKTFYAKWSRDEVTVTFKNDEQVVETKTVKYGEDVIAPELTKAGYTLSWDKELTNVTSDMEVNSIWTANTDTPYKIEYYLRNKDEEVEGYDLDSTLTVNKTGTTDTTVNVEDEDIKDITGFTYIEDSSNNVLTGAIAGDGSTVLKLYYSRNSYSITYELNGGTGDNLSNTYMYGKEFVLSRSITKEGYTFEGWYDNSEFTGEEIKKIEEGDTGDKTFYAKWTTEDQIKLGDINGDGNVSLLDLSLINQAIVGKITLNNIQKKAADINKDGHVTLIDLSLINQVIVGKITL